MLHLGDRDDQSVGTFHKKVIDIYFHGLPD